MGKSDETTSPLTLVVLVVLGAGVLGFAFLMPNEHHHPPGPAAIGALKTLATSQTLFREGDKDGNKTLDYGTLTQLAEQQLIDAVLGSGTKHGYHFTVGPGSAQPEFEWWATATPSPETLKTYRRPRSFFANHTGSIWFTTGGVTAPITSQAAPPPGWQVFGR